MICVVLLCVFTFEVCCDFRIKGSSLSLVVCKRDPVLLTLLVYFAHSGVQNRLCCVFVFLRLVYHMMPVSLDCLFLIVPLVLSNVKDKELI